MLDWIVDDDDDDGFFTLVVMNEEAWGLLLFYITFHVADAAIAFVDLELWGVEDLEGHFSAVAAAFVQHFCTHDSMRSVKRYWKKKKGYISNGIPFQVTQRLLDKDRSDAGLMLASWRR